MELKEYIKEVISEIADAISEVNNAEAENKTIVSPAFNDFQEINGSIFCILERGGQYHSPEILCKIVDVDFDVILTSSSKSEAGGKIGISVLGIGASTGGENAATNHVKFTLPVLFPCVKQPHK